MCVATIPLTTNMTVRHTQHGRAAVVVMSPVQTVRRASNLVRMAPPPVLPIDALPSAHRIIVSGAEATPAFSTTRRMPGSAPEKGERPKSSR